MDEPQKTGFIKTVETGEIDRRKPKRMFWQLTAAVMIFEIILLITSLFLGLAALATINKHHQLAGSFLKYGAVSLPLLSWFCSLYGLSFGRIISALASVTFAIVLVVLFLL